MCGKRLLVISLLLVLASSLLFAWPTQGKKAQEEKPALVIPQAVSSVEPTMTPSTAISTKPESLPISSEEKAVIADQIDAILDQIETKTQASQEYTESVETERDDLAATNAEQADKVVEQATVIQETKKVKGFFKLNAAMHFEDLTPNYQGGLSIGMITKHGIMFELGAMYDLGDLLTTPVMDMSLDRWTFTASIGFVF